LFVHLCSKPEIFSRVEECLEKYAYTAFAPDNDDQTAETRALATKGLRSICLEQVCQWAEEKPVICPADELLPTVKVVEVRLEGQCWDCQLVANLEAELDYLKKLADRLKALAGYKGVEVESDDCWVPPTTTTVVVSTDGTATRTTGNDASTSAGTGTAATGQTNSNGESTTTTGTGTTGTGTTSPHNEEEESEASSIVFTHSSSADASTSAASSGSLAHNGRDLISSESSSAAGSSALATALGIVAASVVAGVAAVGVGAAVSGAGASAAAPASAANMGSASTNPLYNAVANSGENVMY
jgi:hypothetical protein